jgi:predicted nucleic acid-binding protein
MRIALDTNIVAYAEGINDPERQKIAVALVRTLDEASTFLPAQVLGELFRVLRKAKYSGERARTIILRWQNTFPVVETSRSVLLAGIDLAVDHHLTIWDAIILGAAAEAQCRLLLSEDMQEGFTWNRVTVTNPFATKKHELLAGLMGE